jgi:DnaK suppressor protein
MPAKKASRTKKPLAKTSARKAPTTRKAAKAAPRKSRPTAAHARPAKAAKAKSRSSAMAAPAKPTLNAARPAVPSKSERIQTAPKPQPVSTMMPLADSRPAIGPINARGVPRRALVSDDEEDTVTTHNLLLGPRNVHPYRERKGEAYMGRDQLDHFRGILNTWKRDLMEEVDRTMNHMKDEAANPPDPNDRATLESEFALELRTRDRERKLIRKIEEALSRIEDGSYGFCIETGEPIGVKRLEARPVATLCLEAQERRERREKQYGDRDDWYR